MLRSVWRRYVANEPSGIFGGVSRSLTTVSQEMTAKPRLAARLGKEGSFRGKGSSKGVSSQLRGKSSET